MGAKAIWEIQAGLIPGQAEPKHRKMVVITSEEWESAEDKALLLALRQAEANTYANYLQLLCANGMEVNWTCIDFMWP